MNWFQTKGLFLNLTSGGSEQSFGYWSSRPGLNVFSARGCPVIPRREKLVSAVQQAQQTSNSWQYPKGNTKDTQNTCQTSWAETSPGTHQVVYGILWWTGSVIIGRCPGRAQLERLLPSHRHTASGVFRDRVLSDGCITLQLNLYSIWRVAIAEPSAQWLHYRLAPTFFTV